MPSDIGDTAHGTRYGYKKGCRCTSCVLANRAFARKYQQARRWGSGSHLAVKNHDDKIDMLLEILHG